MSENLSSSKAEILARLRSGQTTARLPAVATGLPDGLRIPNQSESERIVRFKEELDSLGVKCYVEEKEQEVRERVRRLIGNRTVLSWDLDQLPYDLQGFLGKMPVIFGAHPRSEQAGADIGITGCDAAIAETGSLVLIAAPGKTRAASLLPFQHIAIVQRAVVYGTMGELFEKRKAALAEAKHVNIITGPSRTADIELSLTLGVHGPGKITVVLGP